MCSVDDYDLTLVDELRNAGANVTIVPVKRAYADWRRYPQYIVSLSESSIDLIFAPAFGSSKKNAREASASMKMTN